MPTPKQGYYLKDGTRVPSVTTVLHSHHPGGVEGLLGWANMLGQQGKSHKEERDKAADAGTLAHSAVEAWVHQEPFDFEGDVETCAKARKCFEGFIEWAKGSQLRVTHTEAQLVSEKHRFGGTIDALLLGNVRAIADWKTSNTIRPNYLYQVAAYGKLWEENNPSDPIVGGYHILRFDKESGGFSHRWWPELDRQWAAFLHLRELYEIDKETTKRVA